MTIDHYENFPVASILLPARLRPAVEAIYAFARTADDIADEGDATSNARLMALDAYETELDRIENNEATETRIFQSLAAVIQAYDLPLQPFRDLLSAFKQDILVKRYATFDALLDYCRRSANPVGALMLNLYGATNTQNMEYSDAICSALQLINFWQDVAVDWQKARIYLPQEDLLHFGVTETQLAESCVNDAWRTLMQFEIERTRVLLISGTPLALRLPGRIGWELRLVIQGGLRILEKIETVDYDIFHRRPQLNKGDWLRLVWRSLRMKSN